jgi:hypothetical protein
MIAGIEWVVTEVDRADNPNQALLGLGALIVPPLAIFPSLMIWVADLFGQGAAASDFLTGMQGMRDTGVIGLRILSVVAGTGVVILMLLLYVFLWIVAAHPHGVLSGLGVALALATSIFRRISS